MMEPNNPELRQRILVAARELFTAQGVDHVSMRKIADRIGYSATTIYLYYRDKSELLNHLVQDYYQLIISNSRPILREMESDPLHALRAYMVLFVEQGLHNPDYFRLMLNLFNERRSFDQARNRGLQVYGDLLVLVELCQQRSLLYGENPQMIVQSLWSLMIGLTTLLTSQPSTNWDNREQLLHFTIEAHLRGLNSRN